MLAHIIRKEIRDNSLNYRFLVACAVSLVLTVSAIAALTHSHVEHVRDYQDRVREQDEFIDRFGHLNRLGWMSVQKREPAHLEALVTGIDREALQENFISNPLPVLLPKLDFVPIVTIIMSLIALLFSYNTITGEKESGMLRLILASGASRRTLLAGKYLGGLISLLIPWTIGVTAGLLFLALSPDTQLVNVDFGVFGGLLAASWLYVAVFFGAGMLCSVRSRTSGQAILKALFAWVLLVLVIPNVSPFLAARLSPIPSAAKIHQQVFQIVDRERDQIVARRSRELLEGTYPDLKEVTALPQDALQAKLRSDQVLEARFAQFSHDRDELLRQINNDQRAKAKTIEDDFEQRSGAQESLARVLTSASPLANFVFIATDLTETGLASGEHWERQAAEYSRALMSYAGEQYNREMAKDPAYSFNDYLDLRQRPRFHYRSAGVAERIAPDIVQWGILAAFSLLFFAWASVSFQSYDVR